MADGFRYDLIPPGTKVLCALSGGADSMYLLCRLVEGAEAGGYAVHAAHFNHQLRETADRDEAFVRGWCTDKEIPLTAERGAAGPEAAARGLGLEECARQMRYAFLERAAAQAGCALIATGHHQGDNAETVLMNLIRGSGLRGLAGIPERRGNIIRPMLAVSRADIDGYLAEHGVPHMEDETNGDERYTRNRVRHTLLPLLTELNPRAAEHIAAAALRIREDEEELSRQAALLLQSAERRGAGWAVPAAVLTGTPRPIALRAAGELLRRAGLAGQAVHLERVLELAAGDAPSARLDLPGGTVWREYKYVVAGQPGAETLPEAPLLEGENRWGRWRITCKSAQCPEKGYLSPNEFYLRAERYSIRSRRAGDEIRLGRRPAKRVKKLLIDERTPAGRRGLLPVLDCGGRVAALGAFGPDAYFLARSGQKALHIILTEEKET